MAPSNSGVLPTFAGHVVPNTAKAGRAARHTPRLARRGRVMVPPFITLIRGGRAVRAGERTKRGIETVMTVTDALHLRHLKGRPKVEHQARRPARGATRAVPAPRRLIA